VDPVVVVRALLAGRAPVAQQVHAKVAADLTKEEKRKIKAARM
jgi:hypothetical protein